MSEAISTEAVQFKRKGTGKRASAMKARERSPVRGLASESASAEGASPHFHVPDDLSNVIIKAVRPSAGSALKQGTKRTIGALEPQGGQTNKIGVDADYSGPVSAFGSNAALGQAIEEEALLKKARSEFEADYAKESGNPSALNNDDGFYHGASGYKNYRAPAQEAVSKAARVGPQQTTSHLRAITIIDYQPDVCKDYKETGFCGFGDTCKFLHDRTDYMAGWQLDKAWDKAQLESKHNRQQQGSDAKKEGETEELPFACAICRKPFTNPVETRCKHYFCQACALKRYQKNPRCAVCQSSTGGLFNKAEKVLAKMKETKEIRESQAKAEQGSFRDAEAEDGIEGLDEVDDDSD